MLHTVIPLCLFTDRKIRDIEWLFSLNFHYYEPLSVIRLHTYRRAYLQNIFVVSRHQQRCADADRDPQNMGDPPKDCGSLVDEKLRANAALPRRDLNK